MKKNPFVAHVKRRPRGSVAPAHRVRRDYRFAQETLDILAQGRVLADNADNETAFVEQAIIHYTAFLGGEVKVNQEIARLQAQVRDLESDLARVRQTLLLAKATTKPQPPPLTRLGPRKLLYQILIKHDSGLCPSLPDGHGFLYVQENEYHCPTHLVFSAPCPMTRRGGASRYSSVCRVWRGSG